MPSPFASTQVGGGSGASGCFGFRELFFLATGGGNTGLAVQGRVYAVVSVAASGGAVLAGSCAGRAAPQKNSPVSRKRILIPHSMVKFCRVIDLRLPDSAALVPEYRSCVLYPATIPSRKISKCSIVPLSDGEARRELVWKAWTDRKQLTQWWGPHAFTNPVCEVDVRAGGAFLLPLRTPNGVVYPMKGVF